MGAKTDQVAANRREAEGFLFWIDTPLAVIILAVETELGLCRGAVVFRKLSHTSRPTNVASNNARSSFVDEEAGFDCGELSSISLVQ